jgi:hypothetical protein
MIKWSDETVEGVARKICGAWGYLWDGDEEDGQVAPEINEPYDERPSKQLYREAAKAALAAVAQSKEVQAKDAALIKARDALNATDSAEAAKKHVTTVELGRLRKLAAKARKHALTAINEVLS